jgi:hypothetical protein
LGVIGAVVGRGRARTPLAIIVAFFIMQIVWIAAAVAAIGALYAITSPHDGIRNFNERHLLLTWIFGAAAGGFGGAYLTPKLFKAVRPATIANGFVYLAVGLLVLGALPAIFVQHYGIVFFVVYFAHAVALVIGAKIGQSFGSASAIARFGATGDAAAKLATVPDAAGQTQDRNRGR